MPKPLELFSTSLEHASKGFLAGLDLSNLNEAHGPELVDFILLEKKLIYGGYKATDRKNDRELFPILSDAALLAYMLKATALIKIITEPILRQEIIAHLSAVTMAAEAVAEKGGTYGMFKQTAMTLMRASKEISSEASAYIDPQTDDLKPEKATDFKFLYAKKIKRINYKFALEFMAGLDEPVEPDAVAELATRAKLADYILIAAKLLNRDISLTELSNSMGLVETDIDPENDSYTLDCFREIAGKQAEKNQPALSPTQQAQLSLVLRLARNTWLTANMWRSIGAEGFDESRLSPDKRNFVFNPTSIMIRRQYEQFMQTYGSDKALIRCAIELYKDARELQVLAPTLA